MLVKQESEQPVVMYVQDMTILDLDNSPLNIKTWDQADALLQGLQNNETLIRWMAGKLASQLPKEDEYNNFDAWCRRARQSPGRVNVWRRMWELYDFENEVKQYPELPHKHWEKMMGRMSKAKRLLASEDESTREKGGELYAQVMGHLKQANDQGHSAERMMVEIKQAEGKNVALTDAPLTISGQLTFMRVNVAGPQERPDIRLVPVVLPKNEGEAKAWQRWADDRELNEQMVTVTIERMDTE